jgi:hypothetical protein
MCRKIPLDYVLLSTSVCVLFLFILLQIIKKEEQEKKVYSFLVTFLCHHIAVF